MESIMLWNWLSPSCCGIDGIHHVVGLMESSMLWYWWSPSCCGIDGVQHFFSDLYLLFINQLCCIFQCSHKSLVSLRPTYHIPYPMLCHNRVWCICASCQPSQHTWGVVWIMNPRHLGTDVDKHTDTDEAGTTKENIASYGQNYNCVGQFPVQCVELFIAYLFWHQFAFEFKIWIMWVLVYKHRLEMISPDKSKGLITAYGSRNFGCLVTWFCYQLIAKPGNKTATVLWPDPYNISCMVSLQL